MVEQRDYKHYVKVLFFSNGPCLRLNATMICRLSLNISRLLKTLFIAWFTGPPYNVKCKINVCLQTETPPLDSAASLQKGFVHFLEE